MQLLGVYHYTSMFSMTLNVLDDMNLIVSGCCLQNKRVGNDLGLCYSSPLNHWEQVSRCFRSFTAQLCSIRDKCSFCASLMHPLITTY